VLAGTVRGPAQVARLGDAMGMPLAIAWLEVPLDVVEARLAGDPNASRADDLRVAAEDLAADGAALPRPEWVVRADRPVAAIVDELLERLGWGEG
jgi:hypothetical protein